MKYTLACFMAFFVAGGVWAQNKSEVALKAKIGSKQCEVYGRSLNRIYRLSGCR